MILTADYKQLEMRLLASEAGEERMLELFRLGKDVHDMTAKELFRKDFIQEERDIAKNINFGTVYGISDYSLAKKFNIQKETAYRFIERHRQLYPSIYRWMAAQHKFIKNNGWIASRFGRIRRLPEAMTSDSYTLERIFRQAGNFPIQSAGADITNTAGIKVDNYLRNFRSEFFLQVHDSIIIDLYPGEEETVTKAIKKIMETKISWLKVSLPVDCKISKRWGGL